MMTMRVHQHPDEAARTARGCAWVAACEVTGVSYRGSAAEEARRTETAGKLLPSLRSRLPQPHPDEQGQNNPVPEAAAAG